MPFLRHYSFPRLTRHDSWLLLGCLVASHYLLVVYISFGSIAQVSIAFLVWWGAWICSEDLTSIQRPEPTRLALFIGSLILTLCVIRGNNMVHPDNLINILAPMEGFALAVLHNSFHGIARFKSSLFTLLLLPLSVVLNRLLAQPEQLISHLTASSSGLLVSLISKEVTVDGRDVLLPTGGVRVYGPCNGTDMISMLVIVAAIFLICFPLRQWLHRLLLIAAAPLVAMTCNSVRIAMLALFAANPSTANDAIFDFFHEEAGSLIFSGVAVCMIAGLHLALLQKQLSRRKSHEVWVGEKGP